MLCDRVSIVISCVVIVIFIIGYDLVIKHGFGHFGFFKVTPYQVRHKLLVNVIDIDIKYVII